MDKKHVLILGAGLMQKPAIATAKYLGWKVTVVDGNPDAMCAKLADRFEPIDLKDVHALSDFALKLKQEEGLDGVFTAGTDFSSSVSYIADELNLPSHTYVSSLNATDKAKMRECFSNENVPSPLFVEMDMTGLRLLGIESLANDVVGELLGIDVDFPLVVKPVDNMGARGCRIVNDIEELKKAIGKAIEYSRTERAIVEEYMDGNEYSIDSLVYDDKIIICGFADRHIYYPPYFIEMGHTMSTNLDRNKQIELLKVFAKGVRALGLTKGVAKGDVKFTSKGPMIGEIAARLSGGYMSGWTFPYSSGINLTERALRIAVGEKIDVENMPAVEKIDEGLYIFNPKKSSAERAWISIPGVVSSMYGFDRIKNMDGVKNVFPRAYVKSSVTFPLNNVEKCGNIISCHDDREEAMKIAELAVSEIVLRLDCKNEDTLEFLEGKSDFPPSAYVIPDFDSSFLDVLEENKTVINSDKPLMEQVPDVLLPFMNNVTDWNHRTISKTIALYESICEKKKCLSASKFWQYLLRGGIQGILYLSDMNM